jgi:hypothetical protein
MTHGLHITTLPQLEFAKAAQYIRLARLQAGRTEQLQ